MENKLKKYKIYSLRSYNDKSVIYYDYTTQFLHKRLSAIKSRYTRYISEGCRLTQAFIHKGRCRYAVPGGSALKR